MSHTSSTGDHARMTVMTFTSPPSLPLSRPWAGVSAQHHSCFTRRRQRAHSLTHKTLLEAPLPHAPHTHEHSSERSQPWSPEPLVYITPGLLCSNLDPSPTAQAPLRARQGAVDEISRFRPDRHPEVNSHKQCSRT
jgi:hypothetical protein